MRLWSVHPEYLDVKGLVALWREALLAKKVLEGKTKGYKEHSQLERFKSSENPLNCINCYLSEVYNEALKRGYSFDRTKIDLNCKPCRISVTEGQLEYEREHLLKKLSVRNIERYNNLISFHKFRPNPIFKVVKGGIEKWEKIQLLD